MKEDICDELVKKKKKKEQRKIRGPAGHSSSLVECIFGERKGRAAIRVSLRSLLTLGTC